MPIYAYQCEECGVRFERRQSFHDDPITVCPECSGHVHRLIQPAGIIFKGSGFYVTDNRGKNPAAPSTISSKKDSAEAKKADTAAPEKPSASAESKSDSASNGKAASSES